MRSLSLAVAASLGLIALSAQAADIPLIFPSYDGLTQIPATLTLPETAQRERVPALVLLHGCGGLSGRGGGPIRWRDALLAQGYAVLIPDSFSPRGLPDGVCFLQGTEALTASGPVRAADAYGALAALRQRPEIDPNRIGLMGFSHGGWTTLATLSERIAGDGRWTGSKRPGFAAAVAFYPPCGPHYGEWRGERDGRFGPLTRYVGVYRPLAPLLILIGGADDWTPAAPCQELTARSRAAGYPVDLVVYPGAHHGFDSDAPVRFSPRRANRNDPSGRGASVGGDPAAWADARQRVAVFWAERFKAAAP